VSGLNQPEYARERFQEIQRHLIGSAPLPPYGIGQQKATEGLLSRHRSTDLDTISL